MADRKDGRGTKSDGAKPTAKVGTPHTGALSFAAPPPVTKSQADAKPTPPGRPQTPANAPHAATPPPTAPAAKTAPAQDNGAAKPPPGETPKRRMARRRAAGPKRRGDAAKGGTSSIGGLIYALEQKPSSRPFLFAALASAVWLVLSAVLGSAILAPVIQQAPTLAAFFAQPAAILLAAAMTIPVALFWFLSLLLLARAGIALDVVGHGPRLPYAWPNQIALQNNQWRRLVSRCAGRWPS